MHVGELRVIDDAHGHLAEIHALDARDATDTVERLDAVIVYGQRPVQRRVDVVEPR
jgi:hypothetical protein